MNRYTYNRAVEWLNQKDPNDAATKSRLREVVMECQTEPWMKEVPYDVRSGALEDLVKARKAEYAKRQKQLAKGEVVPHSEWGYRTKKDKQQSFYIRKRDWVRKRGVYTTLLGQSGKSLRAAEPLPCILPSDARLVRTRLGEYYLCFTEPIVIRDENQAPDGDRHSVISLDPGVRTFMTGYSPDGLVMEWGKSDTTRIHRLCHQYDKLQSRASPLKRQTGRDVRRRRYRMRRAGLQIQKKIRHLIDELHRKLALWLCENYRVIVLPEFGTQNMVKRLNRRIRSETARAMCAWGHYRFRMHLLQKARCFPWVQVEITTEEFTSKTCTRCGTLNDKLGGSKLFRCSACDLLMDRDMNGARNILLKHLACLQMSSPSNPENTSSDQDSASMEETLSMDLSFFFEPRTKK